MKIMFLPMIVALLCLSCEEEKDCSQLKMKWENHKEVMEEFRDNHKPPLNSPAEVNQAYSYQLQKLARQSAEAQAEYMRCKSN